MSSSDEGSGDEDCDIAFKPSARRQEGSEEPLEFDKPSSLSELSDHNIMATPRNETTQSTASRQRPSSVTAVERIQLQCNFINRLDRNGNLTKNSNTGSHPLEYLTNSILASTQASPPAPKKLRRCQDGNASSASVCTHIEVASPSCTFAKALMLQNAKRGETHQSTAHPISSSPETTNTDEHSEEEEEHGVARSINFSAIHGRRAVHESSAANRDMPDNWSVSTSEIRAKHAVDEDNGNVSGDETASMPRDLEVPLEHATSEVDTDFGDDPGDAPPEGIDPGLFRLRKEFGELMSLCEIQHLLSPDSTNGFDLMADFDADSVVILLHNLTDMAHFHSLVSMELKPAVATSKPTHVRVSVKLGTPGFSPSYPDGNVPKTSIRLDQFPCFNIGTALFAGGLTAYVSVHILDNNDTIGQNCPSKMITTWNEVFNHAKKKFRETKAYQDPKHKEGIARFSEYCGTMVLFEPCGGVERGDKGALLNGKIVVSFVMSVMHELLLNIANDTLDEYPQKADLECAQLLAYKSIIVVQSAGFKATWPIMEETLNLPKLPKAPKLKRDDSSIQMYHEYLQNGIAETYKRAFTYFFGPHTVPDNGDDDDEDWDKTSDASCGSKEHSIENEDIICLPPGQRLDRSKFTHLSVYIDVAVKLKSSNAAINIFPNDRGVKCVTKASQARYGNISMPSRDLWGHDNEAHQQRGNASRMESEEEEDSDVENEEVDRAFLFEQLRGLDATNPTKDVADSSGDEEDEKDKDFRTFFRMLQDTYEQKKVDRVRYPLWGTAKPVANAQSKPGCKQAVNILCAAVADESGGPISHQSCVQLMPAIGNFRRCTPIVQIYEPSTRAGLLVQQRRNIRRRARVIPYLIAEMFSELEMVVSKATSDLVPDRKVGVYQRIRESFDVLYSWLDNFEHQQTMVRVEYTFPHFFEDGNYTEPEVPISNEMSPLFCISFASRSHLHRKMQAHVQWLHEGLMQGFCQIENHKGIEKTITPEIWAMYIGMGEMLNAILGSGGGTVDSVLHDAIQQARTSTFNDRHHYYYFQDHMWSPLPANIVFPAPIEGRGFETMVKFGLDPSVLKIYGIEFGKKSLPTIPSPYPREDMQNCLRYLAEKVPVTQIENLQKLHHPSQFRRSCFLLYSSLLRAGQEDASTENTFDAFSKLKGEKIASDPEAMENLLDAIGTILVSLGHFEWSHRIAKAYSKHPDLTTRNSFTVKDMETQLQSSHTLLNIRSTFRSLLEAGFDDPFHSTKELTSAGNYTKAYTLQQDIHIRLISHNQNLLTSTAEIFETITGCKHGVMTMEPNGKQGWKNSGVPRLLLLLQHLCRDHIPPRHRSILDAFGGRDPFNFQDTRDVQVLHHFVAKAVQSQQEHRCNRAGPVVLWNASPSKLAYEIATTRQRGGINKTAKTKCMAINYKINNSRADLGLKIEALPNVNPDDITKDYFVNAFATIRENGCNKSTAILKEEIMKKVCLCDDELQAFRMATSKNPISPVKIIYFQVFLVHLLKHRYGNRNDTSSPPNHPDVNNCTDQFFLSMYPVNRRYNEFKKFIRTSTFLKSMATNDTDVSYETIEAISSKWLNSKSTNIHPSLWELSTTMLATERMSEGTTIFDVWKPTENLDPLQQKLQREQVLLVVDPPLTRAKLTKATIIASYFGILSSEYMDCLKGIRSKLRDKISIYHTAKNTGDKDFARSICTEFVATLALPGFSNNFDFDPMQNV